MDYLVYQLKKLEIFRNEKIPWKYFEYIEFYINNQLTIDGKLDYKVISFNLVKVYIH